MGTRVYDCFLYNGEADVLELRLNELWEAVDHFVIVEATEAFGGVQSKPLFFRQERKRFARYLSKIRYVVVADLPQTENARVREAWQRNQILRATVDAEPLDLILLSDVDEIPRRRLVEEAAADLNPVFCGFKVAHYCLALNYRNVAGPESNLVGTVGARRKAFGERSPHELRSAIREGRVPARLFNDGGWHFSYLGAQEEVVRKIRSLGLPGYDTPEFLKNINIGKTIRGRRDLYKRHGFEWEVTGIQHLPRYVQENIKRFSKYIRLSTRTFSRFADLATYARERIGAMFERPAATKAATVTYEPVIICPYVYDGDRETVSAAFGLNTDGKHLPFYFWKDADLIGPEFAFERCWNEFPDRDVIILHTDMSPMPGESGAQWYQALLEHVDRLPQAGLIACDLVFPEKLADGRWRAQSAGGYFADGRINYLGGSPPVAYADDLRMVREVSWATFGGVYIRRDVIAACGPLDRRYHWAYVFDVDYSLEARKRGYRIFQVPAPLRHVESKTTREFMVRPEFGAGAKVNRNFELFYEKWNWWLNGTRIPAINPPELSRQLEVMAARPQNMG